jgi:hypothetical protein
MSEAYEVFPDEAIGFADGRWPALSSDPTRLRRLANSVQVDIL